MQEEEIDLRPYIVALINKWWLILVLTVGGAIIGFVISNRTVPMFSATSLVTIQNEQELIAIDSSIEDIQQEQPLDAFPELALSDEVLSLVLDELELEGQLTISEFRDDLISESGSDDTVIRLTASSTSPQLSADIANEWANEFVDWANFAYGGKNDEQVRFFEGQLEEATQQLDTVLGEMEAFALIDRTATISNTLAAHTAVHLNYVEQKLQIEQVLNDVETLRVQVESRPATLAVPMSDQIAYMQLQLSTLNEASQLPFIVDLANSDTITSSDREEQLVYIDTFIETLVNWQIDIDEKIEEVTPEILTLQQEHRRFLSEGERLNARWSVLNETVRVLTFQIAEERIASQNQGDGFQIASRAVPTAVTATEQNSVFSIIIGAILGGALAVSLILASYWWQRPS